MVQIQFEAQWMCGGLMNSCLVFPSQARITTRLQQYRAKAELSRNTRPQAWVPREKLPRPLTSSASAIRKLMRKAELMGISTDIFPVDTSDANASMDGRRKHKQPALTADFVNYYLGEQTSRRICPPLVRFFFQSHSGKYELSSHL